MEEHKFVKNDNTITCKSGSIKRWPESGTNSEKFANLPSELKEIINCWPDLSDHIKDVVIALIKTAK